MANVGRNIELAIQSMLKVSEEVADMQAILDSAKSDLNMLETLFRVSKYISLNPQQHEIMPVLEDSIKGVFGASHCQVIYDNDKTHLSYSKELYENLDFNKLKEEVADILVINDVKDSNITNLQQGSLILIRLSIGDELYGFLASYWEVVHNLNPSSLLFLQIVSSQVSMFLRSNSLIEKFKALAVNDPLTGIYNRSYFNNIEDSTLPVIGESIVMFDIDHFKKVNDTMGHQFGDKILIEFANILTDCSQEFGAVPFKYGGEEFIIKCEGGQEVALHIAENVRETFKSKTGYSVSAGVSTIGDSCKVSSYKCLLGQADNALYVSKQSGRDKTTIATGDIQLLKASVDALIRLFSKAFRKQPTATLFRFKITNQQAIKVEEYDKLKTIVASIGRIYDEALFTNSLDILFILDGEVDQQMFVNRIKQHLAEEFNHLTYEIYSLQSIFSEVISHCYNVTEFAQILGKRMGFENGKIEEIILASEWYDIGKICIDPLIYTKKEKLTEEEFEAIKMHTWMSCQVVGKHPTLSDYVDWVLYHHENYNGSGYYGLKGDEIPLEAQIISLSDKFTALTEERFYRPAFDWKQALSILNKDKDQFNKTLFNEFIKVVNEMML